MVRTLKFSNFLKNGDAVLILQGRVSQEPVIMKRRDSLDFVMKFLKACKVDDKIISEVERKAKEQWRKFDEHFKKTKYWKDVKSFSKL